MEIKYSLSYTVKARKLGGLCVVRCRALELRLYPHGEREGINRLSGPDSVSD
jgi:hypothetical protein